MSRPDLSAYTGPIVAEVARLTGQVPVVTGATLADYPTGGHVRVHMLVGSEKYEVGQGWASGAPTYWVDLGDGEHSAPTLAEAYRLATQPSAEERADSLLSEAVGLANNSKPVPLSLIREALVYLGLDGSAELVVVDENQAGPRPWSVRHDPLRTRRQWTAIGPDGRIGADFETKREALLALAHDVARVAELGDEVEP